MALSYTTYTGDGATRDYVLPFRYINRGDVQVFVGSAPATFEFLNESAIRLTTAPVNGAVVRLGRLTNKVSVPVEFTDGSNLLKRDLDLLGTWVLHQAQEATDVSTDLGIIAGQPLETSIAAAVQANASAGLASTAASSASASLQSILLAAGSALVGWISAGVGAVARTVQAKLRDWISVRDFGAVCDNIADDTAAVQAAVNAAYTLGVSEVKVPGMCSILGTVNVPSGVTLYGETSGSEYYPGSPHGTIQGSGLTKPVGGTAGPLVILNTGSAVRGLYLKHLRVGGATTGVVQMGAVGTGNFCYYAAVRDCRIYGSPTKDVSGATTCYGVYFPESDVSTGKQRYYNQFSDVIFTNFDVAVRLGGQSNANQFSNITTRQCYWHYEINGQSSEAVENTFSNIGCHNIGFLPGPTLSVVFTLKNGAKLNVFSGIATECNGSAWSIDDTCSYNKFFGVVNESGAASYVPVRTAAGVLTYNDFLGDGARVNVTQQQEMLLPSLTSGLRFFQGLGNKVSVFRTVSGVLPQCGGGAYPQALVAADADSRVIVQFDGTAFKKSIHPTLFCKLKVFASAPGAAGTSMAECEFLYRPTSTGVAAGVLSVLRCSVKGSAIAGLHFISGKTEIGGTEFRIAVVGGGAVATSMNFVGVSMEIEGLTYDANSLDMSKFANMGFVSTAATANDVTDAVSLLTVADTVI